ncbi:MAG: DegT/DnrJ/EryC1/StrS aminotransferase family protein [Candidatus Omnitrophota bacterium]|nr:DegT/DnrJ/EryC1/StrS aminotransferase family protein [Candidatus Omnitrophota bacterium]
MIPNSRPSIGDDELNEVKKVFSSGWLGMGSFVFDFENAVKDYLRAKYVIAVNTGTSALHIALDALGLGDDDEVIVPSLTFAGTIQAIIACGARPIFCDVEENTLNIDINDVRSKITAKTKVIMPVHYGGLACDMDGLLKTAEEFNLRIVEDAAHAFGSNYKGRKIGSFGDITCFSFDPIKNITCGEGGAVVLSDDKLGERIIQKRILGIDKDTWHRYKNEHSWYYEVVVPGLRYHMSNINAAIGLIQLKKIDKFIEKKRKLCRLYDQEFKNKEEITLLDKDYGQIAPFNYVIKVKKGRDQLMEHLKNNAISAGIHYIPNHQQPLFKPFYRRLPVTESIFGQILTLPLYFDMQDSDLFKVVEAVKKFF